MYQDPLYLEDLDNCLDSTVNIDLIRGKTILITGASGMIGSFLVDALMRGNETRNLDCTIIALGRDQEKAIKRFYTHFRKERFFFLQHDINYPILHNIPAVDFILHSASTTHPVAYATKPISTITTNIFGTYNLLNFLHETCPQARLVLTSSVEIYGQNRGDIDYFDEKYSGYIDCNTLRAGYPESKRLSEALCQAYISEKGIDYVAARLPRTYGPTMLMSDTKALSQFIKKALNKEDIILKSKGDQFFSFIYVADAVSAILSIMLNGACGEAYNIADLQSDITLKDLAQLIAAASNTSLKFEIPDEKEAAGFSTATKAVQSSDKLKTLGWVPIHNIKSGITRTLCILQNKQAH